MSDKDYGPKTGAGQDHPYGDPSSQERPRRPMARPAGKSGDTPPDSHTEIDSEADLDDSSDR